MLPPDAQPSAAARSGTIDEALLRTTKRGGSGIGSYVVKTALENHRGRITIGSSPLGGAAFRISLPRLADARTK